MEKIREKTIIVKGKKSDNKKLSAALRANMKRRKKLETDEKK
jgi:hypothetical protein